MPIVEYVALNGKTIGQICGKHSRRSPAINRPCVDLVISVGIPERSKMCPIIVSTVLVFGIQVRRLYTPTAANRFCNKILGSKQQRSEARYAVHFPKLKRSLFR